MLKISYRNQFKAELKKQEKRGKKLEKFILVAELIALEKPLPTKYRNHRLAGNFKGRWECHIEPDWLLIYLKTSDEVIFERTGTHADLFD